jgi:acyl-CoA synthetase (AMP-forming)/AMP-acid ligase II
MILVSQERIEEYTSKGWWGTETLDGLFRRNVARHPDNVAVVDPANRSEITDGRPRRLTYSELDQSVNQLACCLLEKGLRRDDIIVVQLPNSVELVMVYLAANRLGLVVSPLPVQYREYEIEQIVNFLQAKAFLTATRINKHKHAAMVAALRPELPTLQTILAWGDELLPGVVNLDQLLAQSYPVSLVADYLKEETITANDVFTICWTSGTEGRLKGVPRSHNEWLVPGYGTVDAAELEPGVPLLNPFPMVNMAGIGGMFVPWLLTSGVLVQHHPLNLEVFLRQIAQEKIEYTVAPPALLNMLLQNEALLSRADLTSLKTIGSGSAPLSPWMVKTWREKYRINIINYFASNEGATLVSGVREIPDPEQRAQFFPRFGVPDYNWSARVSASMQSKLVDLQTGAEVTGPGQPGELLIKGAAVFNGYYNDPDLTRIAFDQEGYFHTGDLFEIALEDADPRYYRYVGRSKDIIIRGGQNISPEELENLLQGHPKVADVAVVGYPDPIMGEKTCAVVVPRPGQQISLEELNQFLREKKIAAYKLPEKLLVVELLPRNPVGKILKSPLRNRLKAQA